MISPKSIVVTVVAGVDRLLLFPLSPLAHLVLPLEVLLKVVPRRHVGRREHSRVQPLWKKQGVNSIDQLKFQYRVTGQDATQEMEVN